MKEFQEIIDFIKSLYPNQEQIQLHVPLFIGNENKYLEECINTTFVSSVGKFVDKFEEMMAVYTGAKKAIACMNGTSALHMALLLSGVEHDDEVITQPLTFVATVNAITYIGANPVFIDVDIETMGLSPDSLQKFLEEYGEIRNDGKCYNKITERRIAACIAMHTFGHPCKIDSIASLCAKYDIELIEDAAESIGSKYFGKHTGTFGKFGIFSYNGNKTITTGGGGMIITNDDKLGKLAKHLTTQAKVPHRWEYNHDVIGYNYRMPNLNAALGVAQMENLDYFILKKRELASIYKSFFDDKEIKYFTEPANAFSNYWLNAIILKNKRERDSFLEYSNNKGIFTRPVWKLISKLPMFKDKLAYDLKNAEWLEARVVNIPSSVVV